VQQSLKKLLYLSIICGFSLLLVAGYAAAATTISTNINTAGSLTVGADAAGTNVLFYTDTAGEELLWDASANALLLDGTDGSNVLEVTDGNVTITDDLIVSSQIGIGSSTPETLLAIQGTTEQLRLGYDAANYVQFTVSSGGDLTVAPSGSDLAITGNGSISGTLGVTGNTTLIGNSYVNGYATTTAASGNFATEGTLTVSTDGVGKDVIFYSDTAGDNFTWTAADGVLTLTGTNGQTALNVADGNVVIADDLTVSGTFSPVDFSPSGNVTLAGYLDIGGYATTTVANGNFWTLGEIAASTTLNVVGTSTLTDLNSTGIATLTTAVITNTLNVGAYGAGTDVLFYTEGADEEFLWDASEKMLTIDGSGGADALQVTDGNVTITDDLTVSSGNTALGGTLTVTGDLYVNGYATTTAETGAFASQGSGAFGTTTPTSKLDIFTTGTSTAIMDSSTKGGCFCLKDDDGAGYTCITGADGVITYKSYATEVLAAACN